MLHGCALIPCKLVLIAAFLPALAALLLTSKYLYAQAWYRCFFITIPGFFVFALSAFFLIATYQGQVLQVGFPWISPMGEGGFYVSIYLDLFAGSLFFLTSLLSWCVNLYSYLYFPEIITQRKYFIWLNFFVSAALYLYIAGDLMSLFIAWELTSLFSSLLIAYQNTDQQAMLAGQKAFLTAKWGSAFLLGGIFMLCSQYGSDWFFMSSIGNAHLSLPTSSLIFTITGICFIIAACTKSAQVPFFYWLPNAMIAPTPISALLHAATLLSMGIYLCIRVSSFFSPFLNEVVMIVGFTTAFLGGTAALAQHKIKSLLAYATVSQLGYVFAAIGAQAISAGIAYLLVHALVKAILFLCVGTFNYWLSKDKIKKTTTQSLPSVYSILHKLPVVVIVYVLAGFCLIGLPGFSTTTAKDVIFYQAINALFHIHQLNPWLIIAICLGFMATPITALYMIKSFLVFVEQKEGEDFHRNLFGAFSSSKSTLAYPYMMMQIILLVLVMMLFGFIFFVDINNLNYIKSVHNQGVNLTTCLLEHIDKKYFVLGNLVYYFHTYAPIVASLVYLMCYYRKPVGTILYAFPRLFLSGWYLDKGIKLFAKLFLYLAKQISQLEIWLEITMQFLALGVLYIANINQRLEIIFDGFFRMLAIGCCSIAGFVHLFDLAVYRMVATGLFHFLKSLSMFCASNFKKNVQYYIILSYILILLLFIIMGVGLLGLH